jgi:ADP-heptose:LPS heptosyltransferase
MQMLRRNVLIFHAGALGDFVLSWPLGLALGRMFPQSRIIYVTQKQKGELAEKVLRLESCDIEQGWHHLFGDSEHLPEAPRKRLHSAHSIFTYIAGPGDDWFRAVQSVAPPADIISIDARPPENATHHASHYLLQSLAAHPPIQLAVQQILASIASNGIGASRAPGADAPIVIHPGSGSREKCWPVDSYLELVGKLKAAGRRCKIILGEVELERWPREIIAQFESVAEVIRPSSYVALFQELSAAAAFVGNDSGPSHLAGIVGVPTLALFGPSDPAVWKPLGPRVAVLRAWPVGDLRVEEVEKSLQSLISKL